MIKYALAWVPMVFIAVGNGALRQLAYGPHMSELAAHQLSTLTGCLLMGLYIRPLIRRFPPAGAGQALGVGLLWLALTLAFEFIFMHYAAGAGWDRLLNDYNLAAGRVWPLFLAWLALAPYVFWRWGKRRDQ